MKRDDGSYQLSHIRDKLLTDARNRKSSPDEDLRSEAETSINKYVF